MTCIHHPRIFLFLIITTVKGLMPPLLRATRLREITQYSPPPVDLKPSFFEAHALDLLPATTIMNMRSSGSLGLALVQISKIRHTFVLLQFELDHPRKGLVMFLKRLNTILLVNFLAITHPILIVLSSTARYFQQRDHARQ